MSSLSERERVAAMERQTSPALSSLLHESKTIETQPDCTNVPKRQVTIADALVALRSAPIAPRDARGIRRVLLEVLAALDEVD